MQSDSGGFANQFIGLSISPYTLPTDTIFQFISVLLGIVLLALPVHELLQKLLFQLIKGLFYT